MRLMINTIHLKALNIQLLRVFFIYATHNDTLKLTFAVENLYNYKLSKYMRLELIGLHWNTS